MEQEIQQEIFEEYGSRVVTPDRLSESTQKVFQELSRVGFSSFVIRVEHEDELSGNISMGSDILKRIRDGRSFGTFILVADDESMVWDKARGSVDLDALYGIIEKGEDISNVQNISVRAYDGKSLGSKSNLSNR